VTPSTSRTDNLYVNGTKTDYPGAHGVTTPQSPALVFPLKIAADEFFALGDNRHGVERLAIVRPATGRPDHREGHLAVLAVRPTALLRMVMRA